MQKEFFKAVPPKPKPESPRKYAKTDHEVAVAYSKKGWLPFKSRDAWEESLRVR